MGQILLMIIMLIPITIIMLPPIAVIIALGSIKYDEKVKKILMTVFSLVYNLSMGMMFWWIHIGGIFFALSSNGIFYWIYLIVLLAALLIPINIFMKKKSQINIILYVIISIAMFGVGVLSINAI